MGSPPPMWGKAAISCAVVSDIGITPTHVGKSCHTFEQPFKDKDHPHPCGEKPYISNIAVDEEGSPPPMWGKGEHYHLRFFKLRITPTHVGKSWRSNSLHCQL